MCRVEYCEATPLQKQLAANLQTDLKNVSEESFSSSVFMELRKIACHPLLLRRLYNDNLLGKIAFDILKEVEYCDASQEAISQDLTVMSGLFWLKSDFEIHSLCERFPKSLKKYQLQVSEFTEPSAKVMSLIKMLPEMIERG